MAVLVVVGGYYAWTHFPVHAAGGGPRPSNWAQLQHQLKPVPHPALGGDNEVASIVASGFRDDYFRGETAAPTSVDCQSVSDTRALAGKRSTWGATGPFYDCAVALADGTSTVQCWFKAGRFYRHVVIEGATVDSGSCEQFALTSARVNFTEVRS